MINTQAAKLAKELVDSLDLPSNPNAPSTPGNGQSSCSYDVNGKKYEGKSVEECEKILKELGL
ncbi:MAG: hypothetical protein EOP10_34410 [Proteobacteria bacterium]|nr:MAG: hypothetical protein EOP10_34410 [Pseudomonadota bacterium]